MTDKFLEKPTQEQKVLKVLQDANGAWVSGEYFLHNMYLSQYHARIWGLQKKGYKIEASIFTSEHGFKSYRIQKDGQLSIFDAAI